MYALSSSGQAAIPGYWAGYLAGASLGDVASLQDAWEDLGGTFLYSGNDPGHAPDVLAALRLLGADARFL